MVPHLNRLLAARSTSLAALFAAAGAVALAAAPASALAGYRGRDDDGDRHDRGRRYERRDDDRRDRARGHFEIQIGSRSSDYAPPQVVEERVWVEPVYRTVADRRWVPPVYRTVCERVWIEPVIERSCQRVWVPDRYEWREVVRYQGHRRCVSREYVLVEPGHFVEQPREVVIPPGRYEERPRQELVCEGRWETVERQELVCAGHWETRPVVVAAPPPRHDDSYARIGVRFPIGR